MVRQTRVVTLQRGLKLWDVAAHRRHFHGVHAARCQGREPMRQHVVHSSLSNNTLLIHTWMYLHSRRFRYAGTPYAQRHFTPAVCTTMKQRQIAYVQHPSQVLGFRVTMLARKEPLSGGQLCVVRCRLLEVFILLDVHAAMRTRRRGRSNYVMICAQSSSCHLRI